LAADASQRAVNVAKIQYQEGAVGFNTLVTTLSANVQQQDLLSSTQGSVATNLVQVYKALGGGWISEEEMQQAEAVAAETQDTGN